MNVERNLPVVRERKLAILKGDPELCAQQKKAGKLLARERIAQLLDAASFVEMDVLNADAGVVTGYGLVDGSPVCVYAQDFTVKGGSVGAAHARKVLKVMDLAEKTGAPVVGILDTAGARLDEGVDAMNAYAMMAGRVSALSGVVPQISLVLGPCGGIASAIAGMTDITIMSENGRAVRQRPDGRLRRFGQAGGHEDHGRSRGVGAVRRRGADRQDGRGGHRAGAQADRDASGEQHGRRRHALGRRRQPRAGRAERHRQGRRRARPDALNRRHARHRRAGRGDSPPRWSRRWARSAARRSASSPIRRRRTRAG